MSARSLSAGVLLALAASCRAGGNAPEVHAPPPDPTASAAALPQASSSAPVALPTPPALAMDLPSVNAVLDDPRLLRVRDRERAHSYSEAAWALEQARRSATLEPADACRWSYVLGRMRVAAGDTAEGAAAFDRAADPTCPLAPYASLRAAQAFLRGGRADDAMTRARAVASDVAAKDEAKLVLAEALALRGDKAGAVALWRAFLAATPTGPRWVDTAARLAAALVDGADGPPDTRAAEALELATRVVVEAPRYADSSGAELARLRAAGVLRAMGRTASDVLTPADKARQAQAWLDGGDPRSAHAIVDPLLASMPRVPGDELGCKVATARAQATVARRGAEAAKADAFGEAILRCEGSDALVLPLYQGAKASASASRFAEALARYTKVEQLFPKHRYADDARFHAALLVREMGDEGRALTMLSTLPDAYPEGDMRGEALFRVALARILGGDAPAARAALDRAMTLDPHDHHWGTAGRATYFRGRTAELANDAALAKQRYAQVISEEPLSYYMMQAYARLAAIDLPAARAALGSGASREPPGGFYTKDHPELRSAAFQRALRLLEVGELDAARREFALAGALGDKVDPEIVWSVAHAFNRAGAPELGHAFARGRLTDFLAHYPAGRWRAAWESAFPRAFDTIVATASEASKIPAPLTWAIMREESAFHADAKSHSNALGLMQLLASTAKEVAKGTGLPSDEQSLKRPDVSIPLGAKLLASLRGRFSANPALAIAAYNSGAGSVRKWLDARGGADFDLWVEQIPFDETRNYVKRVLASEAAYAYLYDRPVLDEILAIPVRVTR